MLVNDAWYKETAEDIIWEFENLLCDNDTKINNKNLEENKFENEESYINIKDKNNLKNQIVKQLKDFADFIEYKIDDAA